MIGVEVRKVLQDAETNETICNELIQLLMIYQSINHH